MPSFCLEKNLSSTSPSPFCVCRYLDIYTYAFFLFGKKTFVNVTFALLCLSQSTPSFLFSLPYTFITSRHPHLLPHPHPSSRSPFLLLFFLLVPYLSTQKMHTSPYTCLQNKIKTLEKSTAKNNYYKNNQTKRRTRHARIDRSLSLSLSLSAMLSLSLFLHLHKFPPSLPHLFLFLFHYSHHS